MPSTASSAPSWLTPANLLRASIAVAVLTIALKTLAWYVTASVGLLNEIMDHRMYPLTLEGLDSAMRALTR